MTFLPQNLLQTPEKSEPVLADKEVDGQKLWKINIHVSHHRWSWPPSTSRRWSSAAISTTQWMSQRKYWTTADQTGFRHQYSLHHRQYWLSFNWYFHHRSASSSVKIVSRFRYFWILLLRPTCDIWTTTRCTWVPSSSIRPFHMPGDKTVSDVWAPSTTFLRQCTLKQDLSYKWKEGILHFTLQLKVVKWGWEIVSKRFTLETSYIYNLLVTWHIWISKLKIISTSQIVTHNTNHRLNNFTAEW